MKKSLLYLVIFVLVCFISSGITYIILKNNYDKKISEYLHKINSEETSKVSNNEILLQSELETYVRYLPKTSLYSNEYNCVDKLDKKVLIEGVLAKAYRCWHNQNCPFDMTKIFEIKYGINSGDDSNLYFSLDYINELAYKLYNYKISDLENGDKFNASYHTEAMGYVYQDGYFIGTGGGDSGSSYVTNQIVSYKFDNNELQIIEYAPYYFYDTYHATIKTGLYDFYNKYYITFDDKYELYNRLNENKSKFTKYKHTFKKNDMGYYWYSTEVVKG